MNVAKPFGYYAPKGLLAGILSLTHALPHEGWLAKRLGFFLRKIGVILLNGKPVDTKSLGANLRLHPTHNISERRILFSPDQFDLRERDYLKSIIAKHHAKAPLHEEFIFIDVGANIGGYSLFIAAEANGRARVLAIDPQRNIFERLRYNISLNPAFNITPIDCAVSNKDGFATFFIDHENNGESSLKIIASDRNQPIQVPCFKLSTVLKQNNIKSIHAMKMDVEGAEDIILEVFFNEVKPSLWPEHIIIENNKVNWSFDILSLLKKSDYTVVEETKNNIILQRFNQS